MSIIELLWHDYRYFPYERALARREIESIAGAQPKEHCVGLLVGTDQAQVKEMARLTYFKGIRRSSEVIVPDQARLEASANTGCKWDKDIHTTPTLKRQSTRYSAHGLHEYRGKFNPQVVRAI